MYFYPMYSRELLKGILKPLILQVLSKHERMHGYEMVKEIKKISKNKILVKEGSIYPTLHLLTAKGILTVEEEFIGKRKRKYYKISPKGNARLKELSMELLDFTNTLNSIFRSKQALS